MSRAYLLTGSNMGNRLGYLQFAMQHIIKKAGQVLQYSSVYQTAAWGNTQQDAFLNQVIVIDTALSALALLAILQGIENDTGRTRTEPWAPRTLDIDILFYDNDIIDLPELKVPHPFIAQRKFTLVPLHEIAAQLLHPVLHTNIDALLATCKDDSEVVLFKP